MSLEATSNYSSHRICYTEPFDRSEKQSVGLDDDGVLCIQHKHEFPTDMIKVFTNAVKMGDSDKVDSIILDLKRCSLGMNKAQLKVGELNGEEKAVKYLYDKRHCKLIQQEVDEDSRLMNILLTIYAKDLMQASDKISVMDDLISEGVLESEKSSTGSHSIEHNLLSSKSSSGSEY